MLQNGDLDQQSTANSVFLVQKQTLEELRRIAIKDASRRQWTLVALVLHLVLAVATIGGVLVAVLVYARHNAGDCNTCADNVEYISTSTDLNSLRNFRVLSDRHMCKVACFK